MILWNIQNLDGSYLSRDEQWVDALDAASKPYTLVGSQYNQFTNVPSDLSRYSLIIDLRGDHYDDSALDVSGYETYLETSGNVLYMINSDADWGYGHNPTVVANLIAAIGGGTVTKKYGWPWGRGKRHG